MPVTGIVGYPPSISPEETVAQIDGAVGRGLAALQAAHRARRATSRSPACGPPARRTRTPGWASTPTSCTRPSADAIEFGKRLDGLDIGWFEDIVPPGRCPDGARDPGRHLAHPVAMGDEQGGSYHPQALLKFDAVDFNRARRDHERRHHPAAGHPAPGQGARQRITTHMYPAHPLPGPRGPWLHRRAHRVGHPGHRACTPWTTRSSSPWCATA